MKRSSVYLSGLMLAGSTMFISCEKNDLITESPTEVKNKKVECEVLAFRYNALTGSGTTNQYVFKKQLDPSTGKLQQLTAAAYQGGAISSSHIMDVHWNAGSVVFMKAGSATDTVLVVSLNADGKPANVTLGGAAGMDYLPTSFEYTNSKLSAMKISLAGNQNVSRFSYDNKGNCVLIQDDPQGSITPGRVEYTYDNKKADRQLYYDEPRGFSWNTYSLLQFAGFFPELQPTHLRTGVKVYWGNNYKAYDASIGNHQVQDGTLQRYDVTFSGSTTPIPYFTDWQCGGTN